MTLLMNSQHSFSKTRNYVKEQLVYCPRRSCRSRQVRQAGNRYFVGQKLGHMRMDRGSSQRGHHWSHRRREDVSRLRPRSSCVLSRPSCPLPTNARLLEELHLAHADGSFARFLARLARIDVLILDDWGITPLRDQDRRDLFEVIEDREGARSTIITSQIPVTKWHDHVGDPTIADAIADRLLHRAHRIALKGPSRRKELQESRANSAEQKSI